MIRTSAMRPRILERYVAREFFKLLCLSLVAFVAIFLVVDFFEKIDRLVRAQLSLGEILFFLVLKVPLAVGQVLPAAILLGVVLCFGLLSRNHETLAMRTCGLDILTMARPVLLLAGGAAAVLLLFNLYLIPWSQGSLNAFWENRVEQKKRALRLVNVEQFWYKGDQAIYNILLLRKDINTLEGVKIYLFDRQFNLVQIIAARRAQFQDPHWRFYDGFIQTFTPEGMEPGERFQDKIFFLTERPEDFAVLEKKITEMDVSELSRYVQRLQRDGYKSSSYRVELQNRFALGLTPLILAILGLGLALRLEDRHLPSVVAVGLGLMFLYWLVFGLSASLGQADRWPITVAVWLPHALFGATALTLARRVTR